MPRISLIIPTYNRTTSLMTALKSAQEQVLSDLEIIVADNAANPALASAIEVFNRTARVAVRYVAEPCLGLHHARHAGALAASGEVLVFTDDDATFAPGWLQAYADAFSAHPDMAAAGGPVRPVWEKTPPVWLAEHAGDMRNFAPLSLMDLYQEFRLDKKGIFFGVNMAIRRHVLFKAGGFNPEAFGDVWLGDGESGLNRKLWDQGLLVGYVPGALAYHHIPASRLTQQYLERRFANDARGNAYAAFRRERPGIGRLLLIFLSSVLNMFVSFLWRMLPRNCASRTNTAAPIPEAYTAWGPASEATLMTC